jgi:hypothetical protein
MMSGNCGAQGEGEQGSAAVSQVLNDDHYLNQLLSSMPGVDPYDPDLQGTIAGLRSSLSGSDGEKKPEDDKENPPKKEDQ